MVGVYRNDKMIWTAILQANAKGNTRDGLWRRFFRMAAIGASHVPYRGGQNEYYQETMEFWYCSVCEAGIVQI